MKALSLLQPWATLIAISAKRIETRSWPTDYRGPLAIHASAKFTGKQKELCHSKPFDRVLLKGVCGVQDGERPDIIDLIGIQRLPCGVVLCTCELVDCVPFDDIPNDPEIWTTSESRLFTNAHTPEMRAQERAFGDFSPGRFGWILENVKPLKKAVPAKGSLGLWEWTA